MCAPVGLYLLVFSYDLIQKPEKVTMQKFEKCISLLIWYGVQVYAVKVIIYTYTVLHSSTNFDGPGCVKLIPFASFDFSIPFPSHYLQLKY